MKVLWFTNGSSLYIEKTNGEVILGGWIPSLERLFHERGIELRVAFYSNVAKLTKDEYKSNGYYLIPGIYGKNKFVRWKQRLFNTGINISKTLNDFRQVVDDYNPDVVHFWGSEQLFGLVIPYLKVPHILHIQGVLTAYHQKYYSGFSKYELRKAKTFKDRLKKEPFFYSEKEFLRAVRYEQDILASCRNFFGRTVWDKRMVKVLSPGSNYYHCDEIMRNDFDDLNWKPQYKGAKLRIISIFRDSIYKGIESVYDTAVLLHQKGLSFTWNVVGVDANSPSKKVLKRNRSYNPEILPIKLHGYIGPNEVIRIYKESDLFIHPSHIDNSPNSVCEAMLIGIPIVSTFAGGIPSLIQDNETGILVQDGDNIALAGAVLQVAEDYEKACVLAKKAQSVALVRHNKETVFNTVIDTYATIVDCYETQNRRKKQGK